MDLLEKAGYTWLTHNKPTEFNDSVLFYSCSCIILDTINKTIMINTSGSGSGKSLKSVIKFEVGDKVKFNSRSANLTGKTGIISGIKIINEIKYYLFSDSIYTCSKKCIEPFFEEEEKSDEVDWSKVEVDTPILVYDWSGWSKRHFAKYEDGKVYAYVGGRTSFTSKTEPYWWEKAKLAGKE